MDVEKRMNLSLDEIIQGRRKGSNKPGKGSKSTSKSQGPKKEAQLKIRSRKGAGLGVKRTGLKKAYGGKQANTVQVNRRAPGKNRPTAKKQGITARLNTSLSNSQPPKKKNTKKKNTGQRPQAQRGSQKGPKRVVDVPRTSNLRVTIQNDRVFQQPSFAAPQAMAANLVAPVGYGPRNLPAQDGSAPYLRPAVQAAPALAPLRRRQPSTNYGVSQRILGSRLQQRTNPLVDYDNPSASQSYMRMDSR